MSQIFIVSAEFTCALAVISCEALNVANTNLRTSLTVKARTLIKVLPQALIHYWQVGSKGPGQHLHRYLHHL